MLATLAGGAVPGVAAGQGELSREGALFLLLPVGARSVAMGEAVVAQRGGSESVWWNPAALDASEKREAAIHHSQSIVGDGNALTIVIPSSLLGVLAASVDIVDYGAQDVTIDPTTLGRVLPRSFVYQASYATPIGSRLSAGISYKILQFRVDCTGPCPSSADFSASSSALDFGAQYRTNSKDLPLVFGVAVRNIGVRLQVKDNPQSDPLPTRLQIGAQYMLAVPASIARDTEVRVELDGLDELSFRHPSARLGTEISWQRRAHLRAGYIFDDAEAGGPTIGFGLVLGAFTLDLGRIVSGLSADAGQAPTFLSLRLLF
jgi:hypothetical protein